MLAGVKALLNSEANARKVGERSASPILMEQSFKPFGIERNNCRWFFDM